MPKKFCSNEGYRAKIYPAAEPRTSSHRMEVRGGAYAAKTTHTQCSHIK